MPRNARVRAFVESVAKRRILITYRADIENAFQPREAGFFVPPDPERMFDPRPNRPRVIQSCDCLVDAQGVMYLTDNNAGLYILQFEGP